MYRTFASRGVCPRFCAYESMVSFFVCIHPDFIQYGCQQVCIACHCIFACLSNISRYALTFGMWYLQKKPSFVDKSEGNTCNMYDEGHMGYMGYMRYMGYIASIHQTFSKDLWNMYQTFVKHLSNIYETFTKHLSSIYQTFSKDLWNMCQTFSKHLSNM